MRAALMSQLPVFDSPASSLANQFLWGSWTDGNMGVLLRAPDGMDVSSQGNHAQATLMHASIKPPNPMYPTHGDPQCFSNGQCQDGDDWPHCNDDEGPWGYATVGIVV